MKYLYVIRHAKSSWEDPGLRDFDRPLNKRGKRDAPFMADLFSNAMEAPDIVISSPAKRAKTTALYFQREWLTPAENLVLDESLYHADVHTILGVVGDIDDRYKRAAIFGHNPGFTSFVNKIGKAELINLPTCGIVAIESQSEKWSEFGDHPAKTVAYHYPKKYLN